MKKIMKYAIITNPVRAETAINVLLSEFLVSVNNTARTSRKTKALPA